MCYGEFNSYVSKVNFIVTFKVDVSIFSHLYLITTSLHYYFETLLFQID